MREKFKSQKSQLISEQDYKFFDKRYCNFAEYKL